MTTVHSPGRVLRWHPAFKYCSHSEARINPGWDSFSAKFTGFRNEECFYMKPRLIILKRLFFTFVSFCFVWRKELSRYVDQDKLYFIWIFNWPLKRRCSKSILLYSTVGRAGDIQTLFLYCSCSCYADLGLGTCRGHVMKL